MGIGNFNDLFPSNHNEGNIFLKILLIFANRNQIPNNNNEKKTILCYNDSGFCCPSQSWNKER